MFVKLELRELHQTPVLLQLVDQSIKIPHGIMKGVFIHVDKFYFPIVLIVIDTQLVQDSKKNIFIILGRPFLEKSRCTHSI